MKEYNIYITAIFIFRIFNNFQTSFVLEWRTRFISFYCTLFLIHSTFTFHSAFIHRFIIKRVKSTNLENVTIKYIMRSYNTIAIFWSYTAF